MLYMGGENVIVVRVYSRGRAKAGVVVGVCMTRAWGSEVKPLLARGTLEGNAAFGVLLPQAGQSGRGGVECLFACSNHLKILDVSPIGLKILHLISAPVFSTSR